MRLCSKARPARQRIGSAVRRDMSIAQSVSHPAQLRRSGTKKAACFPAAPTELGLIYWLKPYKHVAPNGASALQYQLFNRASRMPKHTLTGNIKRHRAFHSRVLGNRRDVLVYLPPSYRRFSSRRYPVLYLHDGQNVFDAATSFAGVEWGVDETAQRLIYRRLIEPLIVVAVANIGIGRAHV